MSAFVKALAAAGMLGLAGLAAACREEPVVEINTPEGDLRIEQDGEINIEN